MARGKNPLSSNPVNHRIRNLVVSCFESLAFRVVLVASNLVSFPLPLLKYLPSGEQEDTVCVSVI